MHLAHYTQLPVEANHSEIMTNWLNHEHSLTDKLNAANLSSELKTLSQQWIHPSWWEHYALQLHSKPLFLREILMQSQGVNYWYARTIIPQACYQLNTPFFNRLNKESLRNLIFDNDEVVRVERKIYPVNSSCIEHHWVKKHEVNVQSLLWARLSHYVYQQQESFYLIELLFPELEGLGA